jgi:hypothetical protein
VQLALDLREFDQAVQRLGVATEAGARALVGHTAQRALDILRQRVPVRTGKLRDSLQIRREGELSAFVGTDLPYARFLTEGTRPHRIVPRQAQALRFEAEGAIVFARAVQHPGTRPVPFVEEATQELITAAQEEADALLARELP